MNTWDINILVNGSRCKQYQHEGKTFIEAKSGSEYSIEIKNNYYQRILAVSAVDGLNVLTGQTASETDSGYIVGGYSAEKIKGFRYSDDEWALFKFGYKFDGKTYAQSKQDGSEKNLGVIGVRLFYEKQPEVIFTTNNNDNILWNFPNYPTPHWGTPCPDPWWDKKITCDSHDMLGMMADSGASYLSDVKYGCCNVGDGTLKGSVNATFQNSSQMKSFVGHNNIIATSVVSTEPKGFDMGTEWGRKEKSKVQTISFERGVLAHSLDIYYASRESLIEMGVPLTNELKVNLPQSFPNKYATPPKNWVG